MSKALYRKYRSTKLDDVVGQEHITKTLGNAIRNKRIAHAYLFTGPRGIGKTSVARIMAFEINKLPYDGESTHLDIIEIDAASNRGIDEIRSLREKAYNVPSIAKYKVYIIDEVHMLTKEAFNALLKILEEPPQHVIFILATTEVNRLPETIISRTQRFSFKPAKVPEIIKLLKRITVAEKITISDEALKLIAQHARGSFRDGVALLDQIRNTGHDISVGEVRDNLGLVPNSAIMTLKDLLFRGSSRDVIDLLDTLTSQGFQALQIARQLVYSLRNDLVNNKNIDVDLYTKLIRELIDVSASHDDYLYLQIILLEVALKNSHQSQANTINDNSTELNAENDKVKKDKEPLRVHPREHTPTVKSDLKASASLTDNKELSVDQPSQPNTSKQGVESKTMLSNDTWQKILLTLKQKHNTLYSIIKDSEPTLKNDKLNLNFKYQFHQKRISESKNIQIIRSIASEYIGRDIEIECVVSKSKNINANRLATKSKSPSTKDPIDLINNIFGGGEILE